MAGKKQAINYNETIEEEERCLDGVYGMFRERQGVINWIFDMR
jgi:hypothetical protein